MPKEVSTRKELSITFEKDADTISVFVAGDRRSLRHPAILAVTPDNRIGIRLGGALLYIEDVEEIIEKAIGEGQIEPVEEE